ncbi:MAG: polyprenyl synthetase family protein, partial [Phycisphaerae bacterium]|nr:polyprenyl synthetase family protein [Phycisphaerae bacterium]
VHVAFPRWATDMLPAYLLNLAYGVLLDNPLATEDRRIRVAVLLGRVGRSLARGQEMDLTSKPAQAGAEAALLECCRLKTAHLFAAATAAGAILCGAGEADAESLEQAGMAFGLAYQFLDDIADAPPPWRQPAKASPDAGKLTAVSVFGPQGAQTFAKAHIDDALSLLSRFGRAADSLRNLVAGEPSAPSAPAAAASA